MHVETAAWTRVALAELDLPAGSRALDIGSSTLHYRTVEQPHIEEQVLAPLRQRGVEVVHLDAKEAPGVDVVCDLDEAGEPLAGRLGEHELVLITSVLTYDPVDHMLRMSREELAAVFERRGLERVRAESVRIYDSRYYRGLRSRASWSRSGDASGCRCGLQRSCAASHPAAALAAELRRDAPAGLRATPGTVAR